MVEPADTGVRQARGSLEAALVDAEPVLFRIAERLCGNRHDARDLVQDTVERAMRHGLPEDVRSPIAWLSKVMHRLFLDRCRAAARRPLQEQLAEEQVEVSPMADDTREPKWVQITLEDVRVALSELDPTYREVYELHTFQSWSYERIAEKLSIQRITVGTRLNRARKKLREVLVLRFGLEEEES